MAQLLTYIRLPDKFSVHTRVFHCPNFKIASVRKYTAIPHPDGLVDERKSIQIAETTVAIGQPEIN
jgi:hypothetical protein